MLTPEQRAALLAAIDEAQTKLDDEVVALVHRQGGVNGRERISFAVVAELSEAVRKAVPALLDHADALAQQVQALQAENARLTEQAQRWVDGRYADHRINCAGWTSYDAATGEYEGVVACSCGWNAEQARWTGAQANA